jgi:hypothetical protein
VLSQILLGLREIRTPLAVGYLWLVALWIGLQADVPSRVEATGTIRSLYEIGDTATLVGGPVALSFVAYLAGAISQDAFRPVLLWLGKPPDLYPIASHPERRFNQFEHRRFLRRLSHAFRTTSLEAEGRLRHKHGEELLRIWQRIRDQLMERYELKLSALSSLVPTNRDTEPTRSQLDSDDRDLNSLNRFSEEWRKISRRVPDVTVDLMDKRPDLYQERDRQLSEFELRFGLVPAIGAVSVALASRSSLSWLLLLFILPILVAQGFASLRRANDIVASASERGIVGFPELEAFTSRTNLWFERAAKPTSETEEADLHS